MAAFGRITPGSGANTPGSSFVPTLQASLKAPASTSVNGGGLIPQQMPFRVPNGSLPNPGMPNLFPSTPTGPQPPDIFGNTPDPTTGALHGRGASTAGGVPQPAAKPVAAPTVPGLNPAPTPMQYTGSLPQVMSAWNNYQTGYNTYATNLRSQMEQAAIAYGTPVPGSDTGGRTVAQMLGYNVDPATQALAAAATKSGVSTLAQLAVARTNALRNAAFAGNAGGVSGSSAQYVDTNERDEAGEPGGVQRSSGAAGSRAGIRTDVHPGRRAALERVSGLDRHRSPVRQHSSGRLPDYNDPFVAGGTSDRAGDDSRACEGHWRAVGADDARGGTAPPFSTMAQLIGQGMTPALATEVRGRSVEVWLDGDDQGDSDQVRTGGISVRPVSLYVARERCGFCKEERCRRIDGEGSSIGRRRRGI